MRTSKSKNKISYRYYTIPKFYLPAGDVDNITREVAQNFLDSDMIQLLPETQMAYKQVIYNDQMISNLIDKIVYHNEKLTYFINIHDLSYLKAFKSKNYFNSKTDKLDKAFLSEDKKHLIIEKPIILQKGAALANKYNGKGTRIITKAENANTSIKALSIGWKYRKIYESGTSTDEIIKLEKIVSRTVYKYINLAYLSPKIINAIMDSKIPESLTLQKLFEISSKYNDFKEQEKNVDMFPL